MWPHWPRVHWMRWTLCSLPVSSQVRGKVYQGLRKPLGAVQTAGSLNFERRKVYSTVVVWLAFALMKEPFEKRNPAISEFRRNKGMSRKLFGLKLRETENATELLSFRDFAKHISACSPVRNPCAGFLTVWHAHAISRNLLMSTSMNIIQIP